MIVTVSEYTPQKMRFIGAASITVLDPVKGQSLVQFGAFPRTYFGGAVLDGYAFTKR